jgi:16S rRNA (guanine527-N7)-methyltransferase
MTLAAQLEQGLLVLGIDLPNLAQNQLLAYAALLDKWNRTYRLTGQKDPRWRSAITCSIRWRSCPLSMGRHCSTWAAVAACPASRWPSPRPDLRVVLLDSNSKKTAFLQQVAIELGLANIAVHCGRVEAYRPTARFSVISARAFADLAELVTLSRHLLQRDGHWLAMKGLRPLGEMANLSVDVVVDAVHRLNVPGVTGERHLVVMSSDQARH